MFNKTESESESNTDGLTSNTTHNNLCQR